MISKPTVLILGAGASAHLRYPTGINLLGQICNRIKQKIYHKDKAIEDLHRSEEIQDFYMRLSRSGYYSVDTFLEDNREFIDIGKIFIADCLKQFENWDILFPPSDPGWYQYLFNRMITPSVDQIEQNKVAIITFNYDRSLEAYLHQAIIHRYNVSEDISADVIRQLNIIHPHGILGKYPEIPYSNDLTKTSLYMISQSIKIIHEINDTSDTFCSPEFEMSHKVLQESQKIYFLGFGFHEDNIRRFRFFSPDSLKGKEVNSAIGGLGEVEKRQLLDKLSKYGFSQKNIGHDPCNYFFSRVGTLE
jgi:hypothetical protein